MGQPKSRKSRILRGVQRNRRRRTLAVFIVLISAGGLAAAGLVEFGHFPGQGSGLPSYLEVCVPDTPAAELQFAYHSHPNLTIIISGLAQAMPEGVGLSPCMRALHTHDDSGAIHIETLENRDYTLGDFFLVWGQHFDPSQILSYHADAQHQISMTVNGLSEPRFQNYPLPRDAETAKWGCAVGGSQGNCKQYNIVISYDAI